VRLFREINANYIKNDETYNLKNKEEQREIVMLANDLEKKMEEKYNKIQANIETVKKSKETELENIKVENKKIFDTEKEKLEQ